MKDPKFWLSTALLGTLGAYSYGAGALFGDKDMYLKEHRRLLDLKKQGIDIPEQLLVNTRLAKGRSKDELMAIEQAKIARGEYGNTEFVQTRDEKLLRPEDIWGYSTFFKRYGNDWLEKFSEQERRDIAQTALDANAVKEHHGTVDVDWNKVDELMRQKQEAQVPQEQPGQPLTNALIASQNKKRFEMR